jgi:hypothetical protein
MYLHDSTGVKWGRGEFSSIFFLPKNSFLLATEVKRGK